MTVARAEQESRRALYFVSIAQRSSSYGKTQYETPMRRDAITPVYPEGMPQMASSNHLIGLLLIVRKSQIPLDQQRQISRNSVRTAGQRPDDRCEELRELDQVLVYGPLHILL